MKKHIFLWLLALITCFEISKVHAQTYNGPDGKVHHAGGGNTVTNQDEITGGYHGYVQAISDRDTIPSWKCSVGCRVTVMSDTTDYVKTPTGWFKIPKGGTSSITPIPPPTIIGKIYGKGKFTNTSDFTNHAFTSVTLVGNALTIVGSGGNYNTLSPYLDLNIEPSAYENFYDYIEFTVNTGKGANTRGLVLGQHSTGASQFFTGVGLDLSSDATYGGHLVVQTSQYGDQRVSKSPTTIGSYSYGDKFALRYERKGNIIVGTAWNLTKGNQPITVIYFYSSFPSTIQPNLSGTGVPCIQSIGASGDSYSIDSLSYVSKDITHANLWFVGHSKFGLGANYNAGWIKQLGNNYSDIVMNGFGGEQMIDIYNRRHSIRDAKPKNVVIYMDPANDPDSTVYKTYFKAFVDTIKSYGINVFVYDGIFESAKSIQWYRDYIRRTIDPAHTINVYDKLNAVKHSLILNVDSLHLTGLGDTLLYNYSIDAGKFPGAHSPTDFAKLNNLLSMDVNDNNPANGSNVLNSYIMNGAKFTDANGVPYVSLGSGNHTLFQNLLGWGLDIDGNFGGIGGVWLRSQSGILLLYNHQCFIMADNGVSSSKFSSTGTSYFQTRADSSSYIVSDPNDVYKGFRVDRYGTHLGQMNAGFPRTSAFDVMSSFQFFSGIPRMHASDRDAILKECVGTVTVTAGGTGYHNGDIISFGGGGNNSGNAASGTINVTSGVITGVNLSFSGFGYTGVPTSANVSGTGSGATFTYTMSYPVGAMAYILNDSAIDGTLGVIEIFNGSTWKKLW